MCSETENRNQDLYKHYPANYILNRYLCTSSLLFSSSAHPTGQAAVWPALLVEAPAIYQISSQSLLLDHSQPVQVQIKVKDKT